MNMTREIRKCDKCGLRRIGTEVGNAKYFANWQPGRYWICDECKAGSDEKICK